jgi:superfamily II DNA or RNA helicase
MTKWSSNDREIMLKIIKIVPRDLVIECLYKVIQKSKKTEKQRSLEKKQSKMSVRKTIEKTDVADDKKARSLLEKMDLSLTGLRPGDTIIGSMPGTKGAVMKVHSLNGTICPYRKNVQLMRNSSFWENYLVKLNSYPFFQDIVSHGSIEEYLAENTDVRDTYLTDFDIVLEVINLGAIADKMSEDSVTKLMSARFCKPVEIENEIPKKLGSNARKHTLVMKSDFWEINQMSKIVENYNGPVLDMSPSQSAKNPERSKIPVVVSVLDNIFAGTSKDMGFRVPLQKTPVNIRKVLENNFHISEADINDFERHMNSLPPSAYKSLIQKLIRYQPMKVIYPDDSEIDAEKVLVMAVGFLAVNPGSFVPDIQRFVSGVEAVTKRLAVIAVEDSYIEPEHIYKLLIAALYSKRVRPWNPSEELLVYWLTIATQLMRSRDKFINKSATEKTPKIFKFKSGDKYLLQNMSAIMDELKSFESDLMLFRVVAEKNAAKNTAPTFPRPEYMPFEHFVDQHWVPGIALLAPASALLAPANVEIHKQKPFEYFFKNVWNQCASLNPRYALVDNITEFRKMVSQIQKTVLLSKTSPRVIKRKLRDQLSEPFEYTISEGWIAALVGSIEVRISARESSQGPVLSLVTLDSNDIYNYIAIKKPARTMDSEPLTPKETEDIIARAKDILRAGVRLDAAMAPIEFLKDAKLILGDDGQYRILKKMSDGQVKKYRWKPERLTTSEQYTMLRQTSYSHKKALMTGPVDGISGGIDGISENHTLLFDELINEYLTEPIYSKVLPRVLMYLSGYKTHIEINKISRDGSGTDKVVVLEDAFACQFLMRLSVIYPAAISCNGLGLFTSRSPTLLWTLRDQLVEVLNANVLKKSVVSKSSKTGSKAAGWVIAKDARELWQHQQEILNDMTRQNVHSFFIWLKVGMGKTLIVMNYLLWLQQRNLLPDYVIYTLPKTAIETVAKELARYGFQVKLQVPTQNVTLDIRETSNLKIVRGCKPERFTVTMISSDDHLRMCNDALLDYITDSIFIIDEVHKALNDTQRTGVAIQLASLAHKSIAFTGTPVIDSHLYKLIYWLEKIVPYEVNEKNFWTAANSMIAKVATTGIPVRRLTIKADLKEPKAYYKLAPLMLGGSNANPSREDLHKLTDMSYESCDIEMIKQALVYRDRGVVLVAKDSCHQQVLMYLLSKRVPAEEILVMKTTTNLTPADKSPVRFVIVTIRQAEGYNLTKMSVMITGVYPSNLAKRIQIEGRIDRIGQTAAEIIYVTVHCGILTRILEQHNDAKAINTAIESIHKELKVT